MTPLRITTLISIGILLLGTVIAPAFAAPVTVDIAYYYEGFYSTIPQFPSAGPPPPQDPLSGSYRFTYDDSTLLGVGIEFIEHIVPDESVLSIIGLDGLPVAYTSAGTLVYAEFLDGTLTHSVFGGVASGGEGGLSGATDDFVFSTYGGGYFEYASVGVQPGVGAFAGTFYSNQGHFVIRVLPVTADADIPAPGASIVLAIGMIGLGVLRSRSD